MGFRAAFGDSRKRNTLCSSCTSHWGGRALAASDSLPRVHDVGPDGTAIAQASTPLRDPRGRDEPIPLATHMATLPRRAPVTAHVGLPPRPASRGEPARSGGSRDRGAPGQSGVGSQRGAGVQPFSNCPSPNHACKFPSTWLSRTSCQSCHRIAPHGACDDTQSRE